jgi:hypothetical protein
MDVQTKIYKDIICLEVVSANGPKWWYQGYNMSYSPFPVKMLRQVAKGRLKQGGRVVYTTAIDVAGTPRVVAINMQRSDVWALIKRGLVTADTPLPRTEPKYSDHPERI